MVTCFFDSWCSQRERKIWSVSKFVYVLTSCLAMIDRLTVCILYPGKVAKQLNQPKYFIDAKTIKEPISPGAIGELQCIICLKLNDED